MQIIYKYELQATDFQEVRMPEGSKILTFGIQNGGLLLWVLVDPAAPKKPYKFLLIGTGHFIPTEKPILEIYDYVGTTIGHLGQFVWHLFQEKEEK